MNRHTVHTIIVPVLITVMGIMSGCSELPTEPQQKKLYELTVKILDERGNPLKGVQVDTYPGTVQQITDQQGTTVLRNIPAGNYQVVVSRSDIPIFYEDIEIGMYSQNQITFTVASQVTINVIVRDFAGLPIENISVSTSPNTSQLPTDENGLAVFENIPVNKYTFIVRRNNTTVYIRDRRLIVRNGVLQDVVLVIEPQPPFISIINPPANSYDDIFDIHLEASGFDFEDGELGFDAFTWYSDINGELGTGRELTVDRLSVGHHIISVVGTDSDNQQTSRMSRLNLYYFDKDSYFPLPWGGYWNYRYLVPDFTLVSKEGRTEEWRLENLNVTMRDVNTRNTTLQYNVESTGFVNKRYEYYIVDEFETDVENIYVSKTTERMKIWYGNSPFPGETMEIVTTYSPRYLLIRDHVNFTLNQSYDSSVTADIRWIFTGVSYGSSEFRESMLVETSVVIDGIETTSSDFGTFETVRMTIRQGDTERSWWLAKGIGIIQLDYNTFGTPQVATLYDSNIMDYHQTASLPKFSAALPSSRDDFTRTITIENPPDTPEGLLEIRAFLRNLCP